MLPNSNLPSIADLVLGFPLQQHFEEMNRLLFLGFALLIFTAKGSIGIRVPEATSTVVSDQQNQPLKVAAFALGSFWRSEAVFGCLPGVVRTTAVYAGGSKTNPEFRSLGDHAETVLVKIPSNFKDMEDSSDEASSLPAYQVEYNPKIIQFRQLLDVFWASHDSRQVFGQGPDVGNQYRSIIFTNGTVEARMAAVSKEKEQTKSKSSLVTTQIQQLGPFYPAESDHQKFELKRNPLLLQLMGNMPDEELMRSSLATKLNSYAAELCPPATQKQIDAKIADIIKKGWPVLREI